MRRFLALLCAGVLTLSLAPTALAAAPTNDEQTGATVVTVTPAVPFTTSQDTSEATANSTDPVWMQTSDEWVGEQPTPIGPTVWYVYTAAESGTFSFDLTGSDYSPIMLVLQSDLTVVGFAFGSTEREVLAGDTYYFVIGDVNPTDGVGGWLNVSASILPAPVDAHIGVTGATIVDGQLVVTGTLIATGGDSIWVNLSVEAAQTGKAPATGSSSITDPGETWTVSVPAFTNPWRAVRTTLTVRADYYQDPDEYPDGTFTYVGTLRADLAAQTPVLGNDNLADAVAITGTTGSVNGTTVDATLETGEGSWWYGNSNSVWFAWTLNGKAAIATFTAGDCDTQLHVSAPAPAGPPTWEPTNVIASSYPEGCTDQATMTFFAAGGATYWIRVSEDQSTGTPAPFTLTWATQTAVRGSLAITLTNTRGEPASCTMTVKGLGLLAGQSFFVRSVNEALEQILGQVNFTTAGGRWNPDPAQVTAADFSVESTYHVLVYPGQLWTSDGVGLSRVTPELVNRCHS